MSTFYTPSGPIFLSLFVSTCLALYYLRRRRDLPPGPTPIPIFGNVLQIPTEKTWLYFKSLSEKYGPIVRLKIAGTEVVVLDDIEDVEELLVKRSGNYSSRQQVVYGAKYRSNNKRLVLLPYGMEMKKQRAAIFQMLNARVVGGYEEIQERGSMKLVSDILDSPSQTYIKVKWFTAETLMTLVYGKEFQPDGADLKRLLHILETFVQDIHPARYLVDIFPVLDYLPNFLAPWRAGAIKKYENDSGFYTRLLTDVKTAMDNGADLECFAARLWEGVEKLGLDETSMAFVAGSTFEAGTDNTAGSILWFIEAMMLYPEVFQKAQAEIDSVVGAQGYAAPGFHHLEQLPYCVALVKEVFRWMPVAPVGGPRETMKDDVHKGYHIAAGTVVFANVWSIHHDERRYPDSFKFTPERFIPKDGSKLRAESLNEGHYGFGFGRRTCPGQYLASKSVWIAIVRLIWAFNITAPLDAYGKPILPDPKATRNGITAEPDHYEVSIKPRSETHVQTIKNAMKA